MAKAKLNYQKIRSPKKCFINIQNIDDNECFKSCLVRYLNHEDHHQEELEQLTKIFQMNLILKTHKFSPKLEIFTKLKRTIAKKQMKTSKNIQSKCQEMLSKDILIYY